MGDSARTISEEYRRVLARLLSDVPAARLAAVAQDVFAFLPLPARFSWDDGETVVAMIASLPIPGQAIDPLLVYAARLAHEVDDLLALELNRWADRAGRSIGMAEMDLRRLFVTPQHWINEVLPTEHSTYRYDTAEMPTLNSPLGKDAAHLEMTIAADAPHTVAERSETARIWGGVPLRNPDFTGRDSLLLILQRSLDSRSKASVLPHALHGFGGVGKTQLAIEYAYRFADRYQLVWWIPAEQQSLVLRSLLDLGRQLGVPLTEDLTQASSLVIDALSSNNLRWLLIYDNANEPDDLAHLIPSSGGHVILTSRNQSWSKVWDAIEVNVFERPESIVLIRKRGTQISFDEADQLAETLGDLPLALDQAASWQSATGMPIREYLDLFDQHRRELLSEGKPTSYPTTIAALVKLAHQRLYHDSPAVCQLLEMFAVFGAEPISVDLLRRGKDAGISAPLGPALRDPIPLGRIVRDLRKYGLAKIDADNRIQVHRLFQLVLKDEIGPERTGQSRNDVHRLIGAANPGYPDDPLTHRTHAEIGPHVQAAAMIDSDFEEARRVALDQIRYLWVIGDYEGSRRLGEMAVNSWTQTKHHLGIGPDGELTLLATRHLANALLSLGINERGRGLAETTLMRLRNSPQFGPDHEHTISTAGVVAHCQRVAGEYQQALTLDRETVERCNRVFGADDPETLRSRANLAVNLRMLGNFSDAFDIDSAVVRTWEETVTEHNRQLLFAQINLARDLYGLGRYAEALALQQKVLPVYRQIMPSPKHPHLLWAARTHAIALRKTGRYGESLLAARESYRDCTARYGPDHQHSLAATMTYANTLRVNGELEEARVLAGDSLTRYRRAFGEKHPLTLCAAINLAVILRELRSLAEARRLDEDTYSLMATTLGSDHGYTLCAASNLANDLALANEAEAAFRLSASTLAHSREARGDHHPYTLLCAVNAAFDQLTVGDIDDGRSRLSAATDTLAGTLGALHPEVLDIRRGRRAECDIEPPPA